MLGVSVFGRDVTEQKRDELRLRESGLRFRTIFDGSPLAIGVSRDGHTLFVNPAYARLFGLPNPAAAVGRPLAEQLDPQVRQDVVEKHQARLRGEPAASVYETVGLRADGVTIPVLLDVIKIQLPDGPAALAFFLDLTEQQRARREHEAEEAQLRHAQQMESIGTLAAGLAHDFNNILTPILGYADLARASLPPGAEAGEDLAAIRTAGERAQDLVRQILALSRVETRPVRRPVDLVALVKELVKLVTAAFPASITLRTELAENCPPVLGDASALHQVLLNLCTNARDAMGDSPGTLSLTLRPPQPGAEGAARVSLVVQDTGSGMPPEVLQRIDEPFFTTKPRGKGTGLGLPMVYSIVTALGGVAGLQHPRSGQPL